jgi:hypothetical protein
VDVSQHSYDAGAAGAVVLSRADAFADALAGTPLAIRADGPLLLTDPAKLDPRVAQELTRVLPPGATVYLLGGTAALATPVETAITELGYTTVRLSGPDRFATAVKIAEEGLDRPTTVLLATGGAFPDALAGGPAAAQVNGAILLTDGAQLPPATQAYLDTIDDATIYALGGSAARALPTATPLAGPTRFETAIAVAEAFFDAPTSAGLATAANFPDALAGGAHIGGQGGPMLLTSRDSLHPATRTYLQTNAPTLQRAVLYGGTGVLSPTVATHTRTALQ